MPNYDVPSLAPFLPQPSRPTRPWAVWRDHFVDVFLAAAAGNGPPISPRVCKALLISCLEEEGQRVYSTLPLEIKEVSETDFEVTIRQLNLFFGSKINVVVERCTFRQRGQQPSETTAEYVPVLAPLAGFLYWRLLEALFLEALERSLEVTGD